jgi:hypothetical protein
MRSRAKRSANAKAKQASAIARASMSAMPPGYGGAPEPRLKLRRTRLKKI